MRERAREMTSVQAGGRAGGRSGTLESSWLAEKEKKQPGYGVRSSIVILLSTSTVKLLCSLRRSVH